MYLAFYKVAERLFFSENFPTGRVGFNFVKQFFFSAFGQLVIQVQRYFSDHLLIVMISHRFGFFAVRLVRPLNSNCQKVYALAMRFPSGVGRLKGKSDTTAFDV